MRSVLAQEQQQEIQRALDREFAKARHNGREGPTGPKPVHVDDVVQIEIRQIGGHGHDDSVSLFDSRDWSQQDGWPRLLLDIVGAIEHDASSLYGDLMYGVFFHRENNKKDAARVRISIQGGSTVDRSALSLRGGSAMTSLDPGEVMRAVPQLVSGLVDYVARERAQSDSTQIDREKLLVAREERLFAGLEKQLEQLQRVVIAHTDREIKVLELQESLLDRKEERDREREDREEQKKKWENLINLVLKHAPLVLSFYNPEAAEALKAFSKVMPGESDGAKEPTAPSQPLAKRMNGDASNGSVVHHRTSAPVAPPFSNGHVPFSPPPPPDHVRASVSVVDVGHSERIESRTESNGASVSEVSEPEVVVPAPLLQVIRASHVFATSLVKANKLDAVREKLDSSIYSAWDGWLEALEALGVRSDDAALFDAAAENIFRLMSYLNENQMVAMSIGAELDENSRAAFVTMVGALNEFAQSNKTAGS